MYRSLISNKSLSHLRPRAAGNCLCRVQLRPIGFYRCLEAKTSRILLSGFRAHVHRLLVPPSFEICQAHDPSLDPQVYNMRNSFLIHVFPSQPCSPADPVTCFAIRAVHSEATAITTRRASLCPNTPLKLTCGLCRDITLRYRACIAYKGVSSIPGFPMNPIHSVPPTPRFSHSSHRQHTATSCEAGRQLLLSCIRAPGCYGTLQSVEASVY